MKKYLIKNFLLQKISIYYLVTIFCIATIAGIVFSSAAGFIFFRHSIWVALSISLILISLFYRKKVAIILVIIAGILIGFYRSSNYTFGRAEIYKFQGKAIVLSGKISDDISYGPGGDIRFKLKNITVNGKDSRGEVWASTRQNIKLKRSDYIVLSGKLNKGFGGFFASIPGANITQINKQSKNDYGLRTRDNFASSVKLNEPGRTLGLGFLLGQKNDLPEDLQNKIKLLGLSHIVVASGYNLTILVAFARKIFKNISKYLSALLGFFMIFGFILITGFSPSMSRAGIVAGLSLLAWYYGRKVHPVTILLISATITLLVKPSYIWGDLGWYLSFLAFVGVLVLAPLLHHYFFGKDKKPSWFRELTIVTLSAQIMTLPILLYSFGQFSLYALVANILILPVIPFAMMAVFISGISGIYINFASGLLSVPGNLILKYCTFMIDKVANLPGVLNEVKLGVVQMFGLYALLLAGLVFLKMRTKHNFLNDKNIID